MSYLSKDLIVFARSFVCDAPVCKLICLVSDFSFMIHKLMFSTGINSVPDTTRLQPVLVTIAKFQNIRKRNKEDH